MYTKADTAVVNQPAFPTEARNTHTQNTIESAKRWPPLTQACLSFQLGASDLVRSESSSSEVSQKKLFPNWAHAQPQDGAPGPHNAPLLIQQTAAAASQINERC